MTPVPEARQQVTLRVRLVLGAWDHLFAGALVNSSFERPANGRGRGHECGKGR